MITDCRAWITCSHPGCFKQFMKLQAWKLTPTQLAEEAEKNGWEKRMYMKLEPMMYCPAHSKKSLAIQPN